MQNSSTTESSSYSVRSVKQSKSPFGDTRVQSHIVMRKINMVDGEEHSRGLQITSNSEQPLVQVIREVDGVQRVFYVPQSKLTTNSRKNKPTVKHSSKTKRKQPKRAPHSKVKSKRHTHTKVCPKSCRKL